MTTVFIAVFALVASSAIFRSRRSELAATYKQLSPAVPDAKEVDGTPYRGDIETVAMDAPHSRKSLEILPSTRRLEKVQWGAVLAVSPLSVLAFAMWPIAGLGSWTGLVGLAWGLAMGNSLLADKRQALGLWALPLIPFAFVSPWAAALCAGLYAGLRTILDMKDSAAMNEAERERLADPRYLVGSTERRAGRTCIGVGGRGDITAPSARDNSTA